MPKIIYRPNPTPPPFVPPTPVNHYLTFTAQEDGVKIGYIYFSEDYEVQEAHLNIVYSLDGGATWLPYTMALAEEDAQMIELDEGESVMFRGVNQNLAYYLESEDDYQYTKFLIKGDTAASGDVTSLLNAMGGDVIIQEWCFAYLFQDCTTLTQAPSLPATTLADSCYFSMFSGCRSLTSAPSLPATTLAVLCYNSMFKGCTSLTQAPSLPATTLTSDCYSNMFENCTSLISAPSLPATTLATSCYQSMFNGCTSLTQAPTLPSTTLTTNCYNSMFNGCTSLTQAPSLPATTLATSCYQAMFNGCTSLTQAPTLPSTTLTTNCYDSMFRGCTSLNRIEAMFLTEPGPNYTAFWVLNVAATGTFVKNSEATWNVTGVYGVPSGWDVITNE